MGWILDSNKDHVYFSEILLGLNLCIFYLYQLLNPNNKSFMMK